MREVAAHQGVELHFKGTQAGQFVGVAVLAGVGHRPEAIWVVGAIALAIALASASQDIAIDAYAVEVLRKEEQGAAVGARTALYRAAMLVSGGGAISLASRWGWPAVNVLLALVYGQGQVFTGGRDFCRAKGGVLDEIFNGWGCCACLEGGEAACSQYSG